MNKKKISLDELAKIEKAVAEKYGEEASRRFDSNWTTDKERAFVAQQKEQFLKQRKKEDNSFIEEKGFLLDKALINTGRARTCPVCEIYSFYRRDDMYLNKFQCCYKCFLKYYDSVPCEAWSSVKEKLKGRNNT